MLVTSKLISLCLNLIVSFLLTSSIAKAFDFLTNQSQGGLGVVGHMAGGGFGVLTTLTTRA